MRGRWAAWAITTLAFPAPVAAQDEPDATAMRAIEQAVPPQPWYPDGYYDLRIAAEAQAAEFARPRDAMLTPSVDGGGDRYDVQYCRAENIDVEAADDAMLLYGRIALETARLRNEFAQIGYSPAAYAAPLQRFEKAWLASQGGAAIEGGNPYTALAGAVDANRERLNPALPTVVANGGGCHVRARGGFSRGADGAPTIVATQPPGGEVLMINAFAFKVCTRKMPDPWDRLQCRWNEIETGVETPLTGRYVYQVRWPDGSLRRGAREIPAGGPSRSATTLTLKKEGS